jgi:hypothetical protein
MLRKQGCRPTKSTGFLHIRSAHSRLLPRSRSLEKVRLVRSSACIRTTLFFILYCYAEHCNTLRLFDRDPTMLLQLDAASRSKRKRNCTEDCF